MSKVVIASSWNLVIHSRSQTIFYALLAKRKVKFFAIYEAVLWSVGENFKFTLVLMDDNKRCRSFAMRGLTYVAVA